MIGTEQNEKDFENLSKEQILKCWDLLYRMLSSERNKLQAPIKNGPFIEATRAKMEDNAYRRIQEIMRHLQKFGYLEK
jgi:hypothetical protein